MPEWMFTLIVDRPVGDREDEIFVALDGDACAVGEENGAWVVECPGEYPRYRALLLRCIATLSLDLGIATLAVQDEGRRGHSPGGRRPDRQESRGRRQVLARRAQVGDRAVPAAGTQH